MGNKYNYKGKEANFISALRPKVSIADAEKMANHRWTLSQFHNRKGIIGSVPLKTDPSWSKAKTIEDNSEEKIIDISEDKIVHKYEIKITEKFGDTILDNSERELEQTSGDKIAENSGLKIIEKSDKNTVKISGDISVDKALDLSVNKNLDEKKDFPTLNDVIHRVTLDVDVAIGQTDLQFLSIALSSKKLAPGFFKKFFG